MNKSQLFFVEHNWNAFNVLKIRAIFLLLLIFVFSMNSLFGSNLEFVERFKLDEKETIIGYPISITVTKDDLILVSDMKMCHIKIYDNKGKLVRLLGRQGYGPQEFAKPGEFFTTNDGGFGIIDMGPRCVYFYRRIENSTDFKRSHKVNLLSGTNGIGLRGDKLYSAGYYVTDGKEYDCYSIDLKTRKIEPIMPFYEKFGLKSNREVKSRYFSELTVIGTGAYFGISGNNGYYIWEGDLRVVKINLTSKAVSYFGHKTSNYIKPEVTRELKHADESGDRRHYADIRWKMSYVHGLCVGKKHILVVYRGPKKSEVFPFPVQFYTPEGNFETEIIISDYIPFCMFYDDEREFFYSISDEDEEHYINKYKITE